MKAERILQQARDIARSVESWADLSNALFNPIDGVVTTAYPLGAERKKFMRTREYKEIWKLVHDAMDRFGLEEGATPKKSGRFVVRLPQSLHAALEREAAEEKVSLNQLVVAKLATQLKAVVRSRSREGARG